MEKLMTVFGESIDKSCPLKEYPRPQMARDSYICLNGEWDYAIVNKNEKFIGYQGKILVPFSPECLLSGVEKMVTPDDILYYGRKFTLPDNFIKSRVLLHFDAVDYECHISVNGKEVGENRGGYYPFCFDITSFLKKGENLLTLYVTDPSDSGVQAKGKQRRKRGGIWYTPQSGIWQTVWLESVADSFIESLRIVPDIDARLLTVEANYNKAIVGGKVEIFDKSKKIAEGSLTDDGKCTVKLSDFELWSPENPYLYDMIVTSGEDKVSSYFGMRKFSLMKDEAGYMRLALNNKPYFHNGLLDQGYWSDGMYTPASDEAMIYDIKTMKDMGFNMLRKHIKIEPLRWYYHCDRLGMLVWQDMINGGGEYKFKTIGILPFLNLMQKDSKYKLFGREDEGGRKEYYVDADRMIKHLINVVSLAVWVPFNEGWGQFDAIKAYDFFKERDNTRLIDHASGWHDQGYGDFSSKHIYFRPVTFKKDKRAIVLSEFGGYSYPVKGHEFNTQKTFGYKKFGDEESLAVAYESLFEKQIIPWIAKGLSATVYTEVSDVEDECNGLLTYDRKVVKIDIERLRKLNERIKL